MALNLKYLKLTKMDITRFAMKLFMYPTVPLTLDNPLCLCASGCYIISSLGRQDLVTQFLVKMTFLYKLVAKKLDFVLSKLQISI